MEQSFVNPQIDVTYPFPFSLQRDNLDKLLKFYSDKNTSVCFLEGKSGSFKTDFFLHSLNFLNDDVLVFKFKCFEGTTLDDIFLSFFEDLKRYSQQKKLSLKKIETNSLSQRINKYLNYINLPCIVLIDSMENVFNKENKAEKDEIIAFIEHLNSMNKFKTVLVSTHFSADKPDVLNTTTIQVHPFDKAQVKNYFEHYGISCHDEDIETFFQISRGNILYLQITANIILTLKTTLKSLLEEFEKKRIIYEDFILQKLITFIPENVKKQLFSLSLVNEGLPEQYLINARFFTKDQIAYMSERNILAHEYGVFFIKSYLKKYLLSSIAHFEKNKIHTYWRDFYNSLLPIKPNDRPLLISRNTMRSQIEFHNSFILEQRPKEKDIADMSLMSYLNSNLTAWNINKTNLSDYETPTDKKRPVPPKSLLNKDERFEKYELTKDELSLLSMPVDMRQKQENEAKEKIYRTFEQKEEAFLNQKHEKTLKEIFDTAVELEDAHDFDMAYTVYCSSLALNDDKDFYEYEPLILEKLAKCSKKMNKTTDAIDFYNRLTILYSSRNETEKMNEVRLEIAQIYKESYKINHARVIFENFVSKKSPASNSILIRSYIELAEIEEDLSNTDRAVELYKKAFSLLDSDTHVDEDYLANAYFKYALILDDFNQTQSALDFYQKSIRTSKNGGTYLSAAYTNVAEIIGETGNLKMAADYYKLALKTDISKSNYEGVYYICLKLAQNAERNNSKAVLGWLLKSLSAAKRTKEYLYVTNAYIELGDYYAQNQENNKALKSLLLAKLNLQKYDYTQESASNIDSRVNELKKKMNKTEVDSIEKEINQNAQ